MIKRMSLGSMILAALLCATMIWAGPPSLTEAQRLMGEGRRRSALGQRRLGSAAAKAPLDQWRKARAA